MKPVKTVIKKRCSACKNSFLFEFFNKNRSNPDGLQGECRECQNARARTRNRKKAEVKKLKKTVKKITKKASKTQKAAVMKQLKKDKTSDLELRAKDLFLGHLANYMADEDADYKVLANRAGYAPTTVSQILVGPHKVSERFIRAISRKIPPLSMEWNKYRHLVHGDEPVPDPQPLVPSLTNDEYILIVDNEIIEASNGPQNEAQISEALNDYLNEQQLSLGDSVIEVYKLVKMGYELNVIHDLTIYSSVEPKTSMGVRL